MRSLYQCYEAKVLMENIYCKKGHKFPDTPEGTMNIRRLQRGEPLQLTVCQDCPDFNYMGDQIQKSERGWREELRR